ncbi:MAG: ABC transporter ATP-binding protein [Oscillatoriaceae cyanobacterium]
MTKDKGLRTNIKQAANAFKYSAKAMILVWQTSHNLTIIIAILTLLGGLVPAAIAVVGKSIVDSVVAANQSGLEADRLKAIYWVILEALLVMAMAGVGRGLSVAQSLLRVLLGQKVNEMILEKALTLSLVHFEDSEFYDKMTMARREASSRPLSLVTRTFKLVQDGLKLVTYGGLLLQFSPWVVVVLSLASFPAFISETRFSNAAFRLFRWRSPETREQTYLETLIAREDYAKEVQLYQLGQIFLQRYRDIFGLLYREDRNLTLQRGIWGYLLSLLSTAAFYLTYIWIVIATISGKISLGEMTMYLVVFRQGQSTFSESLSSIGGLYEDNLYLSNLYDFLEQEIPHSYGNATVGNKTGDGLRFENVSFTYPGSDTPALSHISFHLKPGEKLAIVGKNGSGKTTLIKLLTKLYLPDQGRITLDGLDLREWDADALRRRIGVIFQDFVRYQFTIGENVGVGDVDNLWEADQWETAAEKGMARPFIDTMPERFKTRLGRWFKGGMEISGGQWQKIALSRAFMRRGADILVLDEPTAAMDAEAEFEIFQRFGEFTEHQMVVLISHRFSTVRMANNILVIESGKLIEQGSHDELLAAEGMYARLFAIQAAGYQ